MVLRKFFFAIIMITFVLGGCGTKDDDKANKDDKKQEKKEETDDTKRTLIKGAPLKDGTYTLTELGFDENGWKATMSITVDKGKIVESNYNYVNEEGELKTNDDNYQKNMSDKTGVGPRDYVPDLNSQLVEKQDAQQVEIVSGATHSSEKFINYSQQLIQQAQVGDTTAIEISNDADELKDGEYSLAEKNPDANGWKAFIKMTVEGGKIAAVDFNYLNAEGTLKTEDEEYQKNMKEKSGTGPQDYIPDLNEALVEEQNTEAISIVSGATHSSHLFKMYAAQLINAAQKGDTTPIEVDNLVFAKE